jgi:hypothetical protein
MRSLHRPQSTEERKVHGKCGRTVCRRAVSPPPAAKRESKPAVPWVPSETLRDKRQPDGKRRPNPQPSPSPSPQQPRPMTSLQLWLNKPKIDQRVQELERQIGQIALGGAGQGNPELHEFLITLVTQLFEAEASEEGGQEGSPGHRCPACKRAGAARANGPGGVHESHDRRARWRRIQRRKDVARPCEALGRHDLGTTTPTSKWTGP